MGASENSYLRGTSRTSTPLAKEKFDSLVTLPLKKSLSSNDKVIHWTNSKNKIKYKMQKIIRVILGNAVSKNKECLYR